METKVDIQCNRLIHLEDSMVMHGVYNTETSVKLVKSVHQMHTTTTPNKKKIHRRIKYSFYLVCK